MMKTVDEIINEWDTAYAKRNEQKAVIRKIVDDINKIKNIVDINSVSEVEEDTSSASPNISNLSGGIKYE